MTILDRILEHKRGEIEAAKARLPLEEVRRHAEEAAAGARPRFREALRRAGGGGRVALIAEVKKASPSKGVIRADFDAAALARWYEEGGAAAVSVLTDERFFQGGLADLDRVRAAVALPVLRKEFILDPYQVYEARAHGADAILLIAAALGDAELRSLIELAESLHLDALVEVHSEGELARALEAGATLVGINNRDLRTFVTTLDVTRRLVPLIPAGATIVSESGIASHEDVRELAALGVHAMLVGEALAKERDVVGAVRRLLGEAIPA